jgi:hypothetical protein
MNNLLSGHNLLLLIVLFFYSCNNKSEEKKTENNTFVETLYEYKNQYDSDGLLIRVDLTSTTYPLELDLTIKEIWLYSYDEDKRLCSEKKYVLKEDGRKELYYHESHEKNKQTMIHMEGNDTTGLVQLIVDAKGNLIQSKDKRCIPEDLYLNNCIETDETALMEYDENNRMIKVVKNDHINKKKRTTTFSYEIKQDTLIKKMYEERKLCGVTKTITLDDYKILKLSYSSNNRLEEKEETIIEEDKDRLTVVTTSYLPESIVALPGIVACLDTTIYINGKEIENVQILNNNRTKKTTEYDHQGNITKEITVGYFR